MTSQITLYTDRSNIEEIRQNKPPIRFKRKAVKYINGFSDGGIVRYKQSDEYGTVKIGFKKVTVTWDSGEKRSYSAFYDEETQSNYSALEIAQNWGGIRSVPWFIAGQTVVIIPRPDGSIALPDCEYRVISVDDEWIEIREISGDRVDRYPIGELPGFPFRNDIVIKKRSLLPIPVRHQLTLAAGKRYLWDKQNLVDLLGQKEKLYGVFRQEQSELSDSDGDFVWAWQREWDWYAKSLAKDRGHGGKKIGTRLCIEREIETIADFDSESFEFVTDTGRRILLLQLYLYPELAIEKLTNRLSILKADNYIEARVGFNNKKQAKNLETQIKRLSGCREPLLVLGEFTGFTHEWLLNNPYKKSETFMKHLIALSSHLPT